MEKTFKPTRVGFVEILVQENSVVVKHLGWGQDQVYYTEDDPDKLAEFLVKVLRQAR